MKTKIAGIVLAIGWLMAFAPSNVIAQRGMGYGYGNRNTITAREIPGLTQEQKDKIDAIRTSIAREMLALNNKIEEKYAALRTESLMERPDTKKVNNILEETFALRLEMAKMRMETHFKIREELNNEQKLLFDMRGGNRFGFRGGFLDRDVPARSDLAPCPCPWFDNPGRGRRGLGRPGTN